MVTTEPRSRLGRGEWIQQALRVVGERGVEAVRVEPLAKRLGVTKGSFYHHFADRDELLVAVLDGWFQQATLMVIEIVNQFSRRPEQRLRRLLELSTSANDERSIWSRVDVGIRDWARRDRRAQSMLETIDTRRLAYIAERLLALGAERPDAETRSFLIYCYIISARQIAATESKHVRIDRVDRCLERLVLDLPGVGKVEEAGS